MNSEDYVKGCTDQLGNQHFYRTLDKDPNQVFTNDIRREISGLKSNGQITVQGVHAVNGASQPTKNANLLRSPKNS